MQLTAAGRTLAREAPIALAALEQAVQRTRLAGSGTATTIRLGYTPMTSLDTLTALLDTLREDHPDVRSTPENSSVPRSPNDSAPATSTSVSPSHRSPFTG